MKNVNSNTYKFCGKEELTIHNYQMYDSKVRFQHAKIPRFSSIDPLCEKYYATSPYVYCGSNPVNRIDWDGREWTYFTNAKGHTTINVALIFSISGNYTVAQIKAYKNAISTQFNNTISEVSDIGSDATHEILHTLRLEHPFEIMQTEDTKLLRVAPNSFVSIPITDPKYGFIPQFNPTFTPQ